MDVELLERLLALMKDGGLTELEYEHKGTKIHLSKQQEAAPQIVMSAPQIPAAAAPAPLPVAPASAPPPGGAASAPVAAAGDSIQEEPGTTLVKAPMVGTFYTAPSPEAETYVQTGDRVNADSVLCILEAMKVMNEIKAECAGEVIAILVENGEPVEFGQPLFRIRTG